MRISLLPPSPLLLPRHPLRHYRRCQGKRIVDQQRYSLEFRGIYRYLRIPGGTLVTVMVAGVGVGVGAYEIVYPPVIQSTPPTPSQTRAPKLPPSPQRQPRQMRPRNPQWRISNAHSPLSNRKPSPNWMRRGIKRKRGFRKGGMCIMRIIALGLRKGRLG